MFEAGRSHGPKVYGFKSILCLFTSILFNFFFIALFFRREPELTWTKKAAAEAEAIASISCSGHGRAFVDELSSEGKPVCDCNTCYGGSDCSQFSPNCPADVDRWVLIKDEGVYQRMSSYLGLNSFGVSRDTQIRALKLLKVAIQNGGRELFGFGYKTMNERWRKLSNSLSTSKRFSLQKLSPQYCTYFRNVTGPSPAYGWLKCEMEEDEDCYRVLRAAGIIARQGTIFGADRRYVRLSLIKSGDDFDLLLDRIKSLVSKEDVRRI